MMLKIDKNVPIPQMRGRGSNRYPWLEMEVGDSFFVPGKTAADSNCAGYGNKRYAPKRFVSRTVEEEQDGAMVKGVRVWRAE